MQNGDWLQIQNVLQHTEQISLDTSKEDVRERKKKKQKGELHHLIILLWVRAKIKLKAVSHTVQ